MQFVNITLDIYNIAIDFIILLAIYSSGINDTGNGSLHETRKWYHVIAVANLAMSGVDIFIRLFEGPARPINFTVLPIAAFFYYALAFLLLCASAKCIQSLLDRVKPQKKAKKLFSGILTFSIAAYCALLLSTPFTKFLYEIDKNNIYSRGQQIYLALAVQLLMYANLGLYLLANRKTVHPLKILIVTFFIFFPQIAQIMQIVLPGLSLVNTGFSLSFIIMFIYSNSFAEGELKSAEHELQDKSAEAEKSRLQIEEMKSRVIKSLSNLSEKGGEISGGRIERVMGYVDLIAVQLRKDGCYKDVLTLDYLKHLERAVPLYDIGKIAVPAAILKKTERLTPEELELFQSHATEGARIIKEILGGLESPEFVQIAAQTAARHHEKWNGTGYPSKLSEEAIPLCARIMALADAFDSLAARRDDKPRMDYDEVFKIIEDGIGADFDPTIAREFLKIKHKAIEINEGRKNDFRL